MKTEPMRDTQLEGVLDSLNRMHPSLHKLLQKFRIFVGGSFVRAAASFNESPRDIDLFVGTSDLRDVLSIFDGCRQTASDNSVHFFPSKRPDALPINVVTRWTYDAPEHVLGDTDFSVCQNAVWYDRVNDVFTGMVGGHYYRDVADGRARYMLREDVPSPFALMRISRLATRGYKATPEDYARAVNGLMVACKVRRPSRGLDPAILKSMVEAMLGDALMTPDYTAEAGEKQRDTSQDGFYVDPEQCGNS